MSFVPDVSTETQAARLDEVLADYLKAQAAASGRGGAGPDRQEWLARHPDLAPALQDFFVDFDHVHGVTAPLRHVLNPAPERRGQNIGSYRVLDEIGAGGMGVVYLAQHVQLERRAALKMLRAGCWATRAERQRFQSEIQAVVGLDHPHIVPIYDVGEHGDIPYYSMKWIAGGSLAGWLADCRSQLERKGIRPLSGLDDFVPYEKGSDPFSAWPKGCSSAVGFGAMAGFLVKVCHAVHHAHQRGILHRDLKPSNILLDWKTPAAPAAESRPSGSRPSVHDLARAVPYVADFGLARRLDKAGAERGIAGFGTGDALTQTGQVLGTPSYMAPEQAGGRSGAATVAADIYSLGAILYELLTGRPPFRRDTPAQTLRDVMDTEPPAPRTLNPAVPLDLETICLKCLDKEPNRRYPSAVALAEELETFLQGEPIQARPLGRWEKLRRWRRRQPVLAALTMALAVSLLAGLGLTTWQWLRSESFRRQAEQHLEALERERTKEEQSFRQAHQAVKDFSSLFRDELEQLPGMQPLRKKTLETVRAYFEEFLKSRSRDKDLRRELADAQLSLADISRQIEAKHEALAQYRKALAGFRELAAAHPEEEEWQLKIGLALQNIGVLLRYTGDARAALDAFTEAGKLYETTPFSAATRRQVRKELAFVQHNLGAIHGDAGRWQEAFSVTCKARDLYRNMLTEEPGDIRLRMELGRCLHNLGVFHQRCHHKKEALSAFEEACAVRAQLARENPLEFDNHLAVAKHHLAMALKELGRTAEACKANQEAMHLREKLVRDNPKVLWYRIGLASSCMDAGVEHKESGRPGRALELFVRAAELLEPLAGEDPKAVQVHLDLVRAWTHLGNEMADLGEDRDALRYFELARGRAEQLTRHDEERLECRQALAYAHFCLARAHTARGRWKEARTAIRQALVEQRPLLERAGKGGVPLQRSKSLALAAEIERALGDWQEAAAAARERAALWPGTADKLFEAAADLARTARAAASEKAPQESTRCAEWSLEILRRARNAGLKNIAMLLNGPDWEPVRSLPGFADLIP
jgi:serine/threonine-protein kinase